MTLSEATRARSAGRVLMLSCARPEALPWSGLPSMCSLSPPTGQEVRVASLTHSSALEKMFHAAPPGTFLRISSKRPGRARGSEGKPYIQPFYALPAERLGDFSQIVQSAVDSGDEAVYTSLAVFSSSVLYAHPGRDQRYSFAGRRCKHFLGIWIDHDVGRSREEAKNPFQLLTAEAALIGTIRQIEKGAIPLPTMTAESGRGRYVIYVFATALANTPAVRLRMRAVHDGLCARLADFAPDRSSGNTVQPFKVPGSPSVIGPVCYAMFEQGEAAAPFYSLEILEESLCVYSNSPAPPQHPRPISLRARSARSPRQNAAPMRKRMDELRRLVRLRTRWTGFRHWLLLAFAEAARRWFCAGRSIEDGNRLASDEVLGFNQSLPDPEDETVVRSAILGSRLPTKPQTNATIARNLAVTIEESHRARLSSLAHPNVVREREEVKQKRRDEKQSRRREIEDRLLSGESVSSIARSLGMSRETIYRRRRKLVPS